MNHFGKPAETHTENRPCKGRKESFMTFIDFIRLMWSGSTHRTIIDRWTLILETLRKHAQFGDYVNEVIDESLFTLSSDPSTVGWILAECDGFPIRTRTPDVFYILISDTFEICTAIGQKSPGCVPIPVPPNVISRFSYYNIGLVGRPEWHDIFSGGLAENIRWFCAEIDDETRTYTDEFVRQCAIMGRN